MTCIKSSSGLSDSMMNRPADLIVTRRMTPAPTQSCKNSFTASDRFSLYRRLRPFSQMSTTSGFLLGCLAVTCNSYRIASSFRIVPYPCFCLWANELFVPAMNILFNIIIGKQKYCRKTRQANACRVVLCTLIEILFPYERKIFFKKSHAELIDILTSNKNLMLL